MCRNIKTLFNFEPPATEIEIRDASLQFVRKLSGFNVPSKANEAAFDAAVEQVAQVARQLIASLVTHRRAAQPRDGGRQGEGAVCCAVPRQIRVEQPPANLLNNAMTQRISISQLSHALVMAAALASPLGHGQSPPEQRFPDVIAVKVRASGADRFDFDVTISSPYDTPARYADAFRVSTPAGQVLGERKLLHDHQHEQPFTPRPVRGADCTGYQVGRRAGEGPATRLWRQVGGCSVAGALGLLGSTGHAAPSPRRCTATAAATRSSLRMRRWPTPSHAASRSDGIALASRRLAANGATRSASSCSNSVGCCRRGPSQPDSYSASGTPSRRSMVHPHALAHAGPQPKTLGEPGHELRRRRRRRDQHEALHRQAAGTGMQGGECAQ